MHVVAGWIGRAHGRARAVRRRERWCAWLLGALLCHAYPAGQTAEAEPQLKAAFVSKLPQFTDWPESTLDRLQRIELCVARPNPFGSSLRELIAGERLGTRPLVVREVDSPLELDACQLLFVPSQSLHDRSGLLDRARRLPILTVGDASTFIDEGGIVALHLINGRVRFDINVEAANQVGVRLSSQLLQLALSVRGGRE
jgi:hypothetical protein